MHSVYSGTGGRARLIAALFLSAVALSGCQPPAEQSPGAAPAGNDDTAELRTELERLENALGRLEFRVYELEAAAGMTNTAEQPEADAAAAPAQPAPREGEIDLTPVN